MLYRLKLHATMLALVFNDFYMYFALNVVEVGNNLGVQYLIFALARNILATFTCNPPYKSNNVRNLKQLT